MPIDHVSLKSMSHRELALRTLTGASVVSGLLLLILFLWYATDVILLIFVGILLAILLSAAIEFVEEQTGWKRPWAFGAVTFILLLGFAAFIAFAVPLLVSQANELSQKVPDSWKEIESQLKQYQLTRWIANETPDSNSLKSEKMEMFRHAGGMLTTITSGVVSAFIVFFVAGYLASSPSLYTKGLLHLVPLKNRERASIVMGAVGYTLRWWLIGQLIVMTAVGVMTAIGLWALGIPLAILLGALAFLLDFVPNFGPILAAIPAILLSFVDSPQKALYVVILYVGVQQLEGMIISPLVMQRTVSLPPVLTIAAQLFMGIVAGPLGLLLAAPLMAVVLVLIKMLYVEEVLDDEIVTPEEELRTEDVPELP